MKKSIISFVLSTSVLFTPVSFANSTSELIFPGSETVLLADSELEEGEKEVSSSENQNKEAFHHKALRLAAKHKVALVAGTFVVCVFGGLVYRISQLNTLLSTANSELGTANTRLTAANDNVGRLTGELATTVGNVDTLNGQLATANGELVTVRGQLTSLRQSVTGVKQIAKTNQTRMSNNAKGRLSDSLFQAVNDLVVD